VGLQGIVAVEAGLHKEAGVEALVALLVCMMSTRTISILCLTRPPRAGGGGAFSEHESWSA